MALFTDTVTIYNKISETEWKRTVVEDVQWSDHADRTNENGKVSVAHSTSVTFPKPTYEGLVLDSSNEEDCIVYGAVEDVIEDVKGKRISDLLEKYPKEIIASLNDISRYQFSDLEDLLDRIENLSESHKNFAKKIYLDRQKEVWDIVAE